MESLKITESSIVPFGLKFKRPFSFGGNTISERVGYYWKISSNGIQAMGEIAPLPGISKETFKKAKHDLDEINNVISTWEVPLDRKTLLAQLKNEPLLTHSCASTRFGVESALMHLAAQAQNISLNAFLGSINNNVQSAYLLQGTNEQILKEATEGLRIGATTFKLKVGNRNIPMDVKNVQDLRALIGKDLKLRLDANQSWTLAEAALFVECIGRDNIEYLEEPIGHMDRLNDFYQTTHMPVALDETLSVLRCGINAPGRCMPTLANQEGVKAYVIKPVILGGVIASLDWIEEARQNGRKVIVSSAFESPVGFEMVKAIASLSNEVAGLGTQRFYEQ